MKSVSENNKKAIEVQLKATKKEKQLVANAVSTITELKNDINELKSIISIVKIDTIYIHDTIQIKEKKNFWGKVKTDTTN